MRAPRMMSLALAVLVGAPLLASAQTEVRPGAEGWLATFARLPAGTTPAQTNLDCDGCTVVVGASPRVDLAEWANGQSVVHLGLDLEADDAATLYALVGLVGELKVWLDDAEVGTFVRGRDREDDRLLTLALTPGRHRLRLRLTAPVPQQGVPTRRWRFRWRFLDENFAPGLGSVRADVGSLRAGDARTAARHALHVAEAHDLEAGNLTIRLRLDMPAGGVSRAVPVALGADEERREATWEGTPIEWTLPYPARGPLRAPLAIDGETRPIGARVAIDRPLLRAMAELAPHLEGASEWSRAALQWRYDELARAVRDADPDRRWRQWLVQDARALARELRRGRDPFRHVRGYARMAHTSALDGSAQPYELFVPPGYRGRGSAGRAWPLLITLHGFKGNAGDYFRNTFGLARDWRGGETLEAHGRYGVAPTEGPMIVIAPQGRGQSMYRTMGEVDILEAIADVKRRFRIDERRIYITGGSMGGTGAAYLPFRHPDLFAASAALAGYHDQRVRQDTHHAGLTTVEQFLQAERSDIDWTENAVHLPMLLVRGTRDRPLAWTRRQVERLRELRYRAEHREPALGHNVWTETYAEGAIFDWLGRYRRPRNPRRVRLRTARERTLESHWVRIDARSESDQFASVDATLRNGEIEATVDGVDGVTFSPEGEVVRIRIGDQQFEGAPPLSLRRAGDAWEVGAVDLTGRKRAGVSGPIRDVFHERLVFVVGTQDPAHTFLNRRVAHHWAHPPGVDVRYPVIDDTDVTPEMIANATLVLVGPPWSNRLHARWSRQLPVRFDWDRRAIHAGGTHQGPQVGAVFVAPNPDAPDHSLLIIAGTTPLGTWRARFLPDILPDWVVYDEEVELARGQWSCGGARRDDGSPNGADPVSCRYRAHGFFDMHWRP